MGTQKVPPHRLGFVIRLRPPFEAAVVAMIISYFRTKPSPQERISLINYIYVLAITLWTLKTRFYIRTSTMGTSRSLAGDYLATVMATN